MSLITLSSPVISSSSTFPSLHLNKFVDIYAGMGWLLFQIFGLPFGFYSDRAPGSTIVGMFMLKFLYPAFFLTAAFLPFQRVCVCVCVSCWAKTIFVFISLPDSNPSSHPIVSSKTWLILYYCCYLCTVLLLLSVYY